MQWKDLLWLHQVARFENWEVCMRVHRSEGVRGGVGVVKLTMTPCCEQVWGGYD